MRKLTFLFLSAMILIGCNTSTKQNKINDEGNPYDLFYLELLNKGKKPLVQNIDSLNEIKDIRNHLKWLKEFKSELNGPLDKINQSQIIVTDTIISMLKENSISLEKGIGVQHSFSKPYSLEEGKFLIFWESRFKNLSYSAGAAYYSSQWNKYYALDSIITIYNSSVK